MIRLDRVAVLERAGDNCLAGELESSVFLGERWESLFAVAGQPVRVFHQAPLAPGERFVHLPPEAVWVF